MVNKVEHLRALDDLRSVGNWLDVNKPPAGRGNRPPNAAEFYSHVALFYATALQCMTISITASLALYASVRPSMARLWIATARKRGYLTHCPEGFGMASGELTEKSRLILGQSVFKGVA